MKNHIYSFSFLLVPSQKILYKMKVKLCIPYARGLEMKSICMLNAFAATKTSAPMSLLRLLMIWTSCGLNKAAARCSSTAHWPFLPRWANSAGTHPSGPVPVTNTRRAPNSYSLCYTSPNITYINQTTQIYNMMWYI